MSIFHELKARRAMAKRRAMLILFEENGKRYLTIACTDWRGIRWKRCFEVQNEVTLYDREPMEWKPLCVKH